MVGGELVEDLGAVGERTGNHVEDDKGEGVDGFIVGLTGVLEHRGREDLRWRPDVRACVETAGKNIWLGRREVGTNVESLRWRFVRSD